jgi:hypothetical protein
MVICAATFEWRHNTAKSRLIRSKERGAILRAEQITPDRHFLPEKQGCFAMTALTAPAMPQKVAAPHAMEGGTKSDQSTMA